MNFRNIGEPPIDPPEDPRYERAMDQIELEVSEMGDLELAEEVVDLDAPEWIGLDGSFPDGREESIELVLAYMEKSGRGEIEMELIEYRQENYQYEDEGEEEYERDYD